jgi:predicted secreted Zn-dependent protease
MTKSSKVNWRKSTYCSNGDCVEVAVLDEEVVLRDSKNRQGAILRFTLIEWETFLNGVRDGEFNLADGARGE